MIEAIVTAILVIIFGAGWIFLERNFKKGSGEKQDDSPSFLDRYQAIKQAFETKRKEKIDEAEKRDFPGLVDALRDDLGRNGRGKKSADDPDPGRNS